METTITPNAPQSTGTEQNAVQNLEARIAAKMTAMREQTERNLIRQQIGRAHV